MMGAGGVAVAAAAGAAAVVAFPMYIDGTHRRQGRDELDPGPRLAVLS